MDRNFGAYDVPPTLQELIRLKEELGSHELFYRGLNFYLELSSFRYFNTPCDVVVFGTIGVDGIHYGLLTDYGVEDHLEHAPVVCVCPMEFDRPTKIIANSLKEFLSISLTDEELFYNVFANEEEYRAAKQQWEEEKAASPYGPTEEHKKQREDILSKLKERIQLPYIDNPYRHLELLARQRQERITAGTQDLLGVVGCLAEGEAHVPYYVHKDERLDIEALKEYMISAPAISKKALIRDIQMNFVLRDEEELCNIVLQALMSLDLMDERERIAEEGE